MTKQEFLESSQPLCLIISLDIKKDICIWNSLSQKKFPDMFHYIELNPSAEKARLKTT